MFAAVISEPASAGTLEAHPVIPCRSVPDINTTSTTSILTAVFQVNVGQPVPPDWFASSTCSGRESWETSGTGFSQAGCPSCHQTNSVKALKETQNTDLNQEKSSIHSGCSLSSCTAKLVREGALCSYDGVVLPDVQPQESTEGINFEIITSKSSKVSPPR